LATVLPEKKRSRHLFKSPLFSYDAAALAEAVSDSLKGLPNRTCKMLQIISGKFFDDGPVNEKGADAVLYSNFWCYQPLSTSVAELRPVDIAHAPISTYVVRYVNRYQPSPRDSLVHADGSQAVEQFRLLVSFWLKAFFHPDLNYVETLCRKEPRHALTETIPSAFVPHFFEKRKLATPDQGLSFIAFFSKVIGMPRARYRLFLSCLATFFNALEAINANFDLAYSMFVYLLEALSKDEHYAPSWNDYEQVIRDKLDDVFSILRPSTVDTIRGVLLEGAQFKLTRRFVAFVAAHLDDRFFRAEAAGIQRPLRKSDLVQSLRNLYQTRSGFVHQLDRVHEQIRVPQFGESCDVFQWENQPYFTMSGLARLTHHVLCEFANRQPYVAKETYAWRSEIPGIIRAEAAPQYWIWQVDGFEAQHAKRRFSGFMAYLCARASTPNEPHLDLRPLMERIEKLLVRASKSDRVTLLAIYFTFNSIIPESDRRPSFQSILQKYAEDGESCVIEILAIRTLLEIPLHWSPDECAGAFAQYERLKYKPRSAKLPWALEVAIEANIANRFLQDARPIEFQNWAMKALFDAAGNVALQQYIENASTAKTMIAIGRVLGVQSPPAANSEGAPSEQQP
jgi:hypothetical protein